MASSSERKEFFEDYAVGYFEDQFPSLPGQCRYMPFRGLGHYRLGKALASSGSQRCYYFAAGEKRYFTVERLPSLHVLEVSG